MLPCPHNFCLNEILDLGLKNFSKPGLLSKDSILKIIHADQINIPAGVILNVNTTLTKTKTNLIHP